MGKQRLLLILLLAGLAVYFVMQRGGAPVNPAAPRPAAPAGCVLDHCEEPAPAAMPPLKPAAAPPAAPPPEAALPANGKIPPLSPGNFDFYVLTLSWSPGFCASDAGSGKAQCDAGSGLGFVVHGLWPQFEQGYPSDCGAGQPVSQNALALTRGVFPDQGLARYEWGKHGTCSGLPPDAYFGAVRYARDQIAVPEAFLQSPAELKFAPADIMRGFMASNPRLRSGMMAVGCKGGVLQELRFCMTKDLRNFRACEEVTRQSCRAGQVRVPPVR